MYEKPSSRIQETHQPDIYLVFPCFSGFLQSKISMPNKPPVTPFHPSIRHTHRAQPNWQLRQAPSGAKRTKSPRRRENTDLTEDRAPGRGRKWLPSLKLTYPLKIDPWKRRFLLETTIFRGYVSFREGNNHGDRFRGTLRIGLFNDPFQMAMNMAYKWG